MMRRRLGNVSAFTFVPGGGGIVHHSWPSCEPTPRSDESAQEELRPGTDVHDLPLPRSGPSRRHGIGVVPLSQQRVLIPVRG
jgi:hypothetical protein